MTTIIKNKPMSPEGLGATIPSADSWHEASPARPVPARYYFNLTDGDDRIPDEEGIVASSIQAAVVSALEAVEELRAQMPTRSGEWRGWRLEIVDVSGRAIQVIPLDLLSAH
ncbi:DUF6894 family protein [Microvirga lotononidis]|uniref:DUF6894 domain-containing protein n=1 Tax=Microvirga lotononidis TaxID=864069 RepID=I4Z2H7_9HYPH|nr:hypothetical protein [Microvirga lotononidis]EIM30419.1 hypothetical protein MicloDRAFT_00009700 [Microvirga lotononidis]WQO30558.1 hypothetical protein U0023_24230 [Microvirga lotononidis]WQO30917.1 hypothetical protein U0023_26270 [Microvirga lotononidis]